MALKLTAFALAAGITLASIAAAQTVDPNATAAPRDAPVATQEQLNMRRRQNLPPGTQTTQELHRVCAWRSDGGAVTGRFMRLPYSVTISTCAVNQSQPLGGSCQCGGRTGNVIEVPV